MEKIYFIIQIKMTLAEDLQKFWLYIFNWELYVKAEDYLSLEQQNRWLKNSFAVRDAINKIEKMDVEEKTTDNNRWIPKKITRIDLLREQITDLYISWLSNKAIADKIGMDVSTVQRATYRRWLRQKFWQHRSWRK